MWPGEQRGKRNLPAVVLLLLSSRAGAAVNVYYLASFLGEYILVTFIIYEYNYIVNRVILICFMSRFFKGISFVAITK